MSRIQKKAIICGNTATSNCDFNYDFNCDFNLASLLGSLFEDIAHLVIKKSREREISMYNL